MIIRFKNDENLREQSVENPWDPSKSVFLGWLESIVSFKFLDTGAVAGSIKRLFFTGLLPALKIVLLS